MSKLELDKFTPKVFRRTNSQEGWKEFFSPASGELRYLTYARLVLGNKIKEHVLKTNGNEWVLFCISGSVKAKVGGKEFEMQKNDMLYLPRNCEAVITSAGPADLACTASVADADSEPQLVRFNDIKDNADFFFDVGTPELGTKRRIYNMVGNNVKASRLLAGFTIGQPSAWTSWPPHEHAESKEEIYLFFDMPKPAFSVQFVYSDVADMEFAEVVQDGDCVTIPGGYHPTAAAPGYASTFLWVMAGYDPARDRDFKHGINIQPDYQTVKFL